jgi:hypothetical protein
MNKFEITDYTLSGFHMHIEYVYGEYYYEVLCDFDWSEECTGHYTDFTIVPISGTFFHETKDEKGNIEITDDYKQWLQDNVKEFRKQTLWLYNESLEKMRELETDDFNYWADYGI